MFVPASIDLIKSIMIHDFEYFTDRLFHSHEYDPFSMHLLALRGEQWKRIRSKLSPVFTPLKVKMIFPVVVDTANELVGTVRQHLKHTNVVEIHHTITNFTIDAITAISFGVNPETLKNGYSEFKKVAEKWFSESIRDSIVRLLMVTWPDLLTFFKVRSVHKDVANFFSKMATDVIDYREKNDVIRQDLLQFLLQIRRDKSLPLTVSEIIAQCIIFFIAGYETTASVITFCLYELALDQKIQQKVREEAKNRGQLNYDVLQRLPYLDKCIKETSRKYPPLPVHFRVCTKDYKVPNTELIIEKGTAVIIPVSAVHYDSDFYKKPQEFNPERFSSNKKLQCVWSPFGDGPRMCLGGVPDWDVDVKVSGRFVSDEVQIYYQFQD
ncbi:hypothetical protein FQA39_LY16836 [Lamprigera yunnana]|nr:hypothetical protein FQA39_LY16836 [Lamprigera yunnana]